MTILHTENHLPLVVRIGKFPTKIPLTIGNFYTISDEGYKSEIAEFTGMEIVNGKLTLYFSKAYENFSYSGEDLAILRIESYVGD